MTGFWDYARALRSRFYVVLPASLAGAVLGLVIAQVQAKQYRATTLLLVQSQAPRFITADAEGKMFSSDHTELQTQALLVQSQAVAERTILKLRLKEQGPFVDNDDLSSALLDSIRIKPIRDTRFLEVSCETTSPDWAAQIANAVGESYIAENLDRRRRRLTEVTGIYSLRYPELDEKLQKAEAELLKFQEEYLVVSSENPEATLRQRELQLLEQLSQAQKDRITAHARLMQLTQDGQVLSDMSLARAIAAEDPWARQLLEQRLNQSSRIVDLRQSFSDGHRDLESAKERLSKIEAELEAAIRSYCAHARRAHEAALWKEQEIQRILDEHRRQIAGLSKVLARYEALRQRRDSLHKLLDPLAKSQAELDLAKGLNLASASIEHRAQPPKHASRPIRTNYVIIGLVLGLLAGVRLALSLEAADQAVHTTEDIERMVSLRSVGTVCRIDKHAAATMQSRALAISLLPSSMTSEQFRSLRTGILAGAPWRDKGRAGLILVTSASLGEGKSLVAVNAAAAFAQLGKPVLLIDADLRRSSLHMVFGLSRGPGLVEALEGNAEPPEVVRATAVPNLFIVTAGERTDRPAELLSGRGVAALVERLNATYDTIWIDSPPLIPVADARDVAQLADLVLLVVRSGVTRHKALARACDLLHLHDGQQAAAVLNDISGSVGRQYGYSRYGYYRDSASESPPRASGSAAAPPQDGDTTS